jgi:predicted transcriptional regulator
MSRFGDLEAAIMDVMWAAEKSLRVREVADDLNHGRLLALMVPTARVSAGLTGLGEAC